MRNKKGFDIPFGNLFAIIAGVAILILAIYATTQLIVPQAKYSEYTQAAAQLSNYLNPIVNGISSAYSSKISFGKNTRVYLTCSTWGQYSPIFGKQTIAFSEESGILKKWTEPGAEISRYNKYVFSDNVTEGKTYYIFSKPFYAGFRVDDLVMTTFNNYCFVAAPADIEEEIKSLGMGNINFSTNVDNCKANQQSVCFGFASDKCAISVVGQCDGSFCKTQYDRGYVRKGTESMYYYGNLLYAAIYSSPEIYECNVKRLGKKIAELGKVYQGKIEVVKTKNCDTLVGNSLDLIVPLAQRMNSSAQMLRIQEYAKEMDDSNCKNLCKIYPEGENC